MFVQKYYESLEIEILSDIISYFIHTNKTYRVEIQVEKRNIENLVLVTP